MPSQGNVRTRRLVKLRYCFGDNRPTRRIRRVRPPILRPSSCEGGGVEPLRETASERKGEATAPAIASERATALLALVLMVRIVSKNFRAVLWVPVAALHHTSNDHLRTHGTSPRESPFFKGFAVLGALLPPRRGHRHSLVAPPTSPFSDTTGIRRHYGFC